MVAQDYTNGNVAAASFKVRLLEMMRPDLYRQNDFRVLSLPTRATEREIQKNLRRIQLAQKFGGGVAPGATPTSPAPLPLVPPPGAALVAEAQSHLEDAERRLLNEFFWFWTDGKGAEDNAALLPLFSYDVETAARMWTAQAARGGEGEGVAIHNLAVMFHTAALDLECWADGPNPLTNDLERRRDAYWSNSIGMWRRALPDERVWAYLLTRVEELNDPRLGRATVEQLRAALPTALLTVNARLAIQASQRGAASDARRQARLMEQFAFTPEVLSEARHHALAPLRQRIYDLCQAISREARAKPDQAAQVAEQLLERARPLLIALDDLLPPGDPQRIDALDSVALAMDEAASIKADSLLPHGFMRDWEAVEQLFHRISRYASTPAMRARLNEKLTIVKNNAVVSIRKSCWFCGEREGAPGSVIEVRMYQRIEYNRYQYYDVPIPRCADCEKTHLRIEKMAGLGAIAGAASGLVTYWVLWQFIGPDVSDTATFWGIVILSVALAVLGGNLAYKYALKSGAGKSKPKKHKMNFPDVQELSSKGWTDIKPS